MTVTPIQLLRSSTPNKRPAPNSLAEGQPAVNTSAEDPGLYFANSNGTALVKIGPCHVGSTPPNSTAVGHSGNSLGESWLQTVESPGNPVLWVWDGTDWRGTTLSLTYSAE